MNRDSDRYIDDSQVDATIRGASIINLILGVWLAVSPYLLNYTTSQARWNQTLFGIAIALLALWRLIDTSARWTSWANVIAGAWLVIAPFVLSYDKTVAYWNEIIAAIIVIVLAVGNANMSNAEERHSHHHAV